MLYSTATTTSTSAEPVIVADGTTTATATAGVNNKNNAAAITIRSSWTAGSGKVLAQGTVVFFPGGLAAIRSGDEEEEEEELQSQADSSLWSPMTNPVTTETALTTTSKGMWRSDDLLFLFLCEVL